ncbi:MAK10-like protein [Tanacetum coccineum]
MGDENPIRTLGDYSKPSHEGYRNTIELPVGNNVLPLRSDTIRLVQNGCSFHGLWSEDPNQHLKDFLKLVDSLDLDGSITTWEDLTTRFLAQFFPPGRTVKLRNDILMFQQHHGESLSEAWTRFKDLLQKVPHHGIDLWLQVQIFYDHVIPVTRRTIDQSADDFPSTSDRCLIELENQVQRLMEAHFAPTQPTQVNKGTTSCKICSGPHDTQYCMKDPEQAIVKYASSHTDEAEGLVSNFMASQDARLSKFEGNFKQQQSEMTNKIDTVLKAITDRIAGALPSDTVKNPKLSSINTITIHSEKQSDSYDEKVEENEEEEKDSPENIHVNPSTPPDPSGEDREVIFIELIRKNDESSEGEPEEEGSTTTEGVGAEYFDIFPTRSALAYHKYLMCSPIPSIFQRNPIIMEGCPSNLKIPCNIMHVKKAYIDPNSPLNIMTRMMYNWIMRRKLDTKENSNNGVSSFT